MASRDFPEKPNPPRRARGGEFYYGTPRSQRDEWDHRGWDYSERDRHEGQYDAGGRDFDEAMDEPFFDQDGRMLRERSWWAAPNPPPSDRAWYESDRARDPSFTGGDRGWAQRRHGIMRGVKSFFGVGPKGYRRSDERICEEVCEALARHPDVDASDIEVQVNDGQVILTGTVGNRWMKRQAEDAVEFVPGVQDVRVELTVSRDARGGSRKVS